MYRGRQDVLRETRHTVEGGSEAEGTVKQSGVRGFPLHRVPGVEFRYLFWGMGEVLRVFPGVSLYSIALPFD